MGHDLVKYEGSAERFHDFDLWILRHFFLEQSERLEFEQPSDDTRRLREFFAQWSWVAPGIIVGTDFSPFIAGSRPRWRLTLKVLKRARNRIAEFGEHIPFEYLETHINTPGAYCTAALPTKSFLLDIERIRRLLGMRPPSVD
jgi:hypothetical protein